jgi:hypothetical protein
MSEAPAHPPERPNAQALHAATREQLAVYETQSVVKAAKIKEVRFGYCGVRDRNTTLLVPEDERLLPIEVSKDFVARWDPKAPGYFMMSTFGDEAWAPVEGFEEAYEMMEQAKPQDLSALLAPPEVDETITGTVA